MKTNSFKWILLVLALLPVVLFLLPLWVISLDAPQFPEGLKMNIYINNVTGTEEHGLESINGLNHYIGMKRIEPGKIPEFGYMPPILAALILLGAIVSLFNKRPFILIWLILFSVAGILGLYDFYLWEKDYGNNLDPHAIIKASGMAYTPPLIGTKEIMNFTVTSLPGIGGWFMFVSLGGGWILYLVNYFKTKSKK